MNAADRQLERERKKHERLMTKLLEKARRRQEQAEADSLFVMGMDHRAPWSERDRAALVINAYDELVKVLSANA
jgi:hypothetical protein